MKIGEKRRKKRKIKILTTNNNKIKQSIEIIETSKKDYEFRMTINKTMHTKEDILSVQNYIKEKKRFFLQPYKQQPTQIIKQDFGEWTKEELQELEEAFSIKA